MRWGFGRHVEYILPTLVEAQMYCVLDEMLSVVATLFIEVSVCLFVRRLIRETETKTNTKTNGQNFNPSEGGLKRWRWSQFLRVWLLSRCNRPALNYPSVGTL